MQAAESYEWLVESCLQECRKGISRLEEIADVADRQESWVQEDLDELLELETAAAGSFAELRHQSDPSEANRALTQEKLDKLQSKLLESLHRLASEGGWGASCL